MSIFDKTPPSSPVVLTETIQLPKSSTKALIVSINRPTQHNCFNKDVIVALSKIFSDIADNYNNNQSSEDNTIPWNDYAAIIFTGVGNSFCAGADLTDPPNPLEQSSDLPEYLQVNPVYQMHRVPIPIIGAVKGHVITGGFELALACDILVGSSSTVFRDTHVKFGLAPCWGLSQKLQRRIGPGRAKLVSFSARPINASLAYEWGLLDEIVPSADNNHEKEKQQGEDDTSLLFRAIEIADMIGSQNQTMVRRYKKALEEGGSMDLHKGLQRERELGLAHYVQAINDGMTFESAKAYIEDTNRPRYHSKL